MRGRPIHSDFHRHIEFIDLVDLAIGLETFGDDLKGYGVTEGNHVDNGFAVFVGFELESASVLIALDRVEDDVSVRDRLAVIGTNDGDGNCRRGRRDFVFPAVVRVIVLGTDDVADGDEAK